MIVNLLRQVIVLLTSILVTFSPAPSDSVSPAVFPSVVLNSDVLPLAIAPSSLIGRAGSTIRSNSASRRYFGYAYLDGSSSTTPAVKSTILGIGVPVSYSSGTTVTVSWSGLTGGCAQLTQLNYSGGTSAISWLDTTYYSGGISYGSLVNVPVTIIPVGITDETGILLCDISDYASGNYTFTLSHDVQAITVTAQIQTNSVLNTRKSSYRLYLDALDFDISVSSSNPIDDAILGMQSGVADIVISNRAILDVLGNIAGSKSAMEQFEEDYLENFGDQISKTEDFMSPTNSALPNDGDIAGFVQDIQDGLGLSGSSFNSTEFKDAMSGFTGSAATGPGGPWEFFTQAVADSLAGDTSSVGLADDDYIYAWLEEAQRRYGSWNSSSP